MSKSTMYKAAKMFLYKNLKNKVNFRTISAYLQSIGFAVILYDRDCDNELLRKYNLLEYSKNIKGFTVFRKDFKAVFIDAHSCREEKLCVLLHEAAHIILGHIDQKDIQEARFMEMEADAFAYYVLHSPGRALISRLSFLLTWVLIFVFIMMSR